MNGHNLPAEPKALTIVGQEARASASISPEGITRSLVKESDVTRPGISSDFLRKAGVRLVEPEEALSLVGYYEPGHLIPYNSRNGEPIENNGKHYARLRLSNPKNNAKYLSPKGSGCQLYEPPGLRELLKPGCVLGIVEGEFKSMALVEAGFPCVGIAGITAACPRNSDKEPELLPALTQLIEEVRPSKFAFIGDTDTALIPAFARETVKLSKLTDVPMVLPRIPLDAPGKGPDDLRKIWGAGFPARWQAILDTAEPVTAEATPAALAVRLLRREAGAFAKLSPDALDKARDRLVKLAHAYRNEPLALAEIENIADHSAGLAKSTLRAAVRKLDDKRAESVGTTEVNNDQLIILPSGDVSITSASENIFGRIGKVHGLFYRGGRVHEIAINSDGTKRLDPVTPAQFRSRLENYGRVFVWRAGADGEKVLKPTLCPEETAKALLESLPARELLPNVTTLSACPVLANTGDEMSQLGPGWHSLGGGLFVTGGESPPRVPLSEAVKSLTSLLDEFDFASLGDRSRALASLIAPGLRFGSWLTNPLPVDIGEADVSQSGKTYRQKIVAAIYRESCNVVVQRTGGVGGLDESISQKLIDGRPFILFDNLRGRLDSPFLEAILTAPSSMPARVPHRGEVQVDPRGFVFQITSNGVETTRDLANRAAIVRIRKRPAGFVFKLYPEGDLHAHIKALQPYFLGCVFAVIAEWATKGQPRTDETRHDFREWAQILDWIVQNIFGTAPLLDGHDEARQRVSDPRRNWLRSLCIALRDANRTGEFFASQLAEFALENDILPPNAGIDSDEPTLARRIGMVMAATFADAEEVEIDCFRIQRVQRYNAKAEKEIHVYQFLEARCP